MLVEYKGKGTVLMARNEIDDDTLSRLEELDRLVLLSLGDSSDLTDASLERIGRLKELEWLWLYDAPITDAGLERISRLTQLSSLILDGTKITHAAASKLKQSMPNCWIVEANTKKGFCGPANPLGYGINQWDYKDR